MTLPLPLLLQQRHFHQHYLNLKQYWQPLLLQLLDHYLVPLQAL
jgi:hypothetical protein